MSKYCPSTDMFVSSEALGSRQKSRARTRLSTSLKVRTRKPEVELALHSLII